MTDLDGKHIVLGVSGGISAYKAAELVRRLRDEGAQVRVVMTQAAQAFVTPLTFQALSGQPVHTDLLDPQAEAAMGHIELGRWADLVLIAPASADLMARLAHGLADDLLTTLYLATAAPIVLAPAMNRLMWANLATRSNAALLEGRGIRLLGPAAGGQACGEIGPGRMVEPAEIVAQLADLFAPGPLAGKVVLVTAGPTYEPIDPVRFVGNRSSGKMGYAVAAAAREAGARVRLVSGPTGLPTPPGVERIDVETAEEMHVAVMDRIEGTDVFIAVAAVADYRPAARAADKIKKTAETLRLELVRNPDILAAVAARPRRPFTVGFAAETRDLEAHARAKLAAKGLDLVAANDVSAGQGFGADSNALTLVWPGGMERLGPASKAELARQLIAHIGARLPG